MIWLTRPIAQSTDMAAHMKHPSIIAPVQKIMPIHVPTIEGTFDAIITTSQHATVGIDAFKDLPLYTVGNRSAETARKLGFGFATALAQDATGLAAMIVSAHPQPMRFLYLSGRETRIDMKALLESRGHSVTQITTYESATETSLSSELIDAWNAGKVTGVVFMSLGAIQSTLELMKSQDLNADMCGKVYAFCVSSVVAADAGTLPWRAIKVSKSPTQQSLIETIDTTISA